MLKRTLVLVICAAASLVATQGAAGGSTGLTCGSIITAPGDYFLIGDCVGGGITIAASKVHLKLDGHTMDGAGASTVGILANDVSKLHIEGPGTITRYDVGCRRHPGNVGVSPDASVGTVGLARPQVSQHQIT